MTTDSREQPESCPTCRRLTVLGLQQRAVQLRSQPIYGTDMSKPLSELVGEIRKQIARARGQLSDIGAGYTGWSQQLSDVEGLLTCGLITLYGIMNKMKKSESHHDQ